MKTDIKKYSGMGASEALGRLELFRDRVLAGPKRAFVDLKVREKDIVFIGDLHGDIFSLARLLESFPPGDDRMLVFLGDYVDRTPDEVVGGALSLVLALIDLVEAHPGTVMLRGNHDIGETMPCSPHEWPAELERRLGGRAGRALELWRETAMALPLVVRTPNGVLAAHGGFPRTAPPERWADLPLDDETLLYQTVWADPGETDSGRGLPEGTNFSRADLEKVLGRTECGCFVRGHESLSAGTTRWGGKVLTIMTAGYYAEQGRGRILIAHGKAEKRVGSAADLQVLALDGNKWKTFRPHALPDD